MPPGSRFILPNGVHCSPDSGSGEELPFPQSQQPSSAPAGLSLAPAGTSNPFLLYRKLSPEPDTFLLLSRASDLHWTSCPAWAPVQYLSFPSVLEVFSSLGQGIPDEPPNVMPDVRIPEREERRLPRQCNSQKKGSLIADSSQGSRRASNAVVGGQRALSPSCYPSYKVCISSW